MIEIDGIKLYTVAEVASWLRVSPQTVRAWIKEDKLKGRRVGRPLLIPEKSIKELVTGETETVSRV